MWEVKGLEETDLPRIADLELAIFPDAWSLPALRESLHQKSRTWLGGIWLGGLLIGYVIFYYVLDEGEIARVAGRSGVSKERGCSPAASCGGRFL